MKKWFSFLVGVVLPGFVLISCGKSSATGQHEKNATGEKTAKMGDFRADSAYSYIERQVAFGPRVPGTPEHDACADYLIKELDKYADTIYVQRGTVTAFNGDVLPITNIIASFNPRQTRRVLLVAHYDTRPWADNDRDSANHTKSVLGANDGGSGVGVILEIARNLRERQAAVGVDIFFTDAEDYGDNNGFAGNADSWCLGTQYWIENMIPYHSDNTPLYGILLDMVGGQDARFHHEAFSKEYATSTAWKVWGEAKRLGHDDIFVNKMGGAVTDDHVFLTNAGIPTLNIIESVNVQTGTFPPSWHTVNDDMSNISRTTLQAVGETVLNVLYKEKAY